MTQVPFTCVGPNRLPFNRIQTDTNRFKTGMLRPSSLALEEASQVLVWPAGQVSLALHIRPAEGILYMETVKFAIQTFVFEWLCHHGRLMTVLLLAFLSQELTQTSLLHQHQSGLVSELVAFKFTLAACNSITFTFYRWLFRFTHQAHSQDRHPEKEPKHLRLSVDWRQVHWGMSWRRGDWIQTPGRKIAKRPQEKD